MNRCGRNRREPRLALLFLLLDPRDGGIGLLNVPEGTGRLVGGRHGIGLAILVDHQRRNIVGRQRLEVQVGWHGGGANGIRHEDAAIVAAHPPCRVLGVHRGRHHPARSTRMIAGAGISAIGNIRTRNIAVRIGARRSHAAGRRIDGRRVARLVEPAIVILPAHRAGRGEAIGVVALKRDVELAEQCGGISGLVHHLGESMLPGRNHGIRKVGRPERGLKLGAEGIAARVEHGARRGTRRHGPGIGEGQPGFLQGGKVGRGRRCVAAIAIDPQLIEARIVRQKQQDIRLIRRMARDGRRKHQSESCSNCHSKRLHQSCS